MDYPVHELAKLSGVSTRTLRYYDAIGLLRPLRTGGGGCRVYGPREVDRLQEILFYRALGVPLAEIGRILDDPGYDRAVSLRAHLSSLQAEKQQLEALIANVAKTLSSMVQLTDGDCEDALLLLARLIPYCERCGRVMDGIHLLLLTALCQERIGSGDWKDTLSRALDTCREYAFVWPVAQYGAAILPLLGSCGWSGSAEYLERVTGAARVQAVNYPRFLKRQMPAAAPLSAQELQVLKLMCENLSNQEIGEILNIKLPTVKTHVSHILQKLGVSRRAEAREAADRLRLIN